MDLFLVLQDECDVGKTCFKFPFSFPGISSSFCLNSGNPHVSGWDVLAERKRRDRYHCRCRELFTRNQGNATEK